MFNYEWKAAFKAAYLDVQHQLQVKYVDGDTIANDCKFVSELADLCIRYIIARENELHVFKRQGCMGKIEDVSYAFGKVIGSLCEGYHEGQWMLASMAFNKGLDDKFLEFEGTEDAEQLSARNDISSSSVE